MALRSSVMTGGMWAFSILTEPVRPPPPPDDPHFENGLTDREGSGLEPSPPRWKVPYSLTCTRW